MEPNLKEWLKKVTPETALAEIHRLRFWLRAMCGAQAEAIITNPKMYPETKP